MGAAELAELLVAAGEYSTLQEAIAALNIVIVDGVGATTSLQIVQGGAATAVSTVGTSALELASQVDMAATPLKVLTGGGGLAQTATGFKVTGLLGMPLGIAAAAIAPLYGVSLGETLYESNPELWTKLSQKLLPFCYPGTTEIPTWAEIAASTWTARVAKSVVDAIKNFFIDENIIDEQGELLIERKISDLNTSVIQPLAITPAGTWLGSRDNVVFWYSDLPTVSYVERNIQHIIAYSPNPGSTYLKNSDGSSGGGGSLFPYTYQGKTVYYQDLFVGPPISYVLAPNAPSSGTIANTAWTALYGEVVNTVSGLSRWKGIKPSVIPEGDPVVTGIDSATGTAVTTPTVPISPPIIIIPDPIVVPQPKPQTQPEIIPFPWPKPATVPEEEPWPETMPWPLPATEPTWWPVEVPYPEDYPFQYPSADPNQQPDPNTVTDPDEQIDPYILPYPYPGTYPVPETKPITNPETDPSTPSRPSTKTDTTPPEADPPPPSGISPVASVPNTPLPFDISQNVGLVTVYHPTAAQLYSFERWLWVTYGDATIDKIFNNPFDGVISLFELYCTPTDVSTQTIRSGFLDSGISSAVISRYTEIDCGTIAIPEYYGNYFDYSPYSKAHIYLPFIGIQELNVDDIVGHAVNVKYRIDEYNGSCIAMITVAKVTEVAGEDVEYSNTMYQFSGNCSVELPFAGGTQAAIKAGMMQADAWQTAANVSAGVNLVGGVASILGAAGVGAGSIGMAMGGVSQALSSIGTMYSGQAQYLSNMLSGKATVQKSGGFGSSHGALGIKTPFITVTRPKQVQVANYNDEYGYPAHKLVYIGNCTGFLRCREVHVVSTTATDDEKNAIEAMLKSGIYVTE